MKTLISVDELHRQLDQPNLLVIDCRFSLANVEAGPQSYLAAHIPGARYLNLNTDLSTAVVPGKTGRHPLPSREAFAGIMGALGANDAASIVAYDDGPGAFAARLWWMLRWLGHENSAVLDGGFRAWQAAGYPVTADVPQPMQTDFAIRAPLTRTVSAADLPDTAHKMLDARDRARYLGQNETIDPVAGHIPGAISAPFA
ncbi:MAG TPA: rhodanese-like domain-containing protein, partial [Pseudomonadales bacterium]|nr:rhodanese-like domain-containing protein [Pseudomonadales bacterium]